MVSFFLSIVLLIVGYLGYGRVVEKVFHPDDRQTPAYSINDGVDYVPMPLWKVFLIQLLNIAGTGPIFGALGGAVFGPVVYLWIVFGCIFAGGVHDYMTGMLSARLCGASISEITGKYLGNAFKQIMRLFSIALLVMIAVVFTTGPADLLSTITPEQFTTTFWFWVVMVYYLIATFVPIDKVIGRFYPVFGLCLIVMACGVSGSLVFSGRFQMPEIWDNFENLHANGTPIWPFMFITVACGAISGFHGTQSPMMARCVQNEKQGRTVFYGAMVAEGMIALVWAAAGVSCYESSRALLEAGAGCSAVVYEICRTTMGKFGCSLAMLGVIVCPISSGDTAYRAARLTLADWFKLDQSNWRKRFLLTLPILVCGAVICQLDYSVVWRYCSWSNQTLATISLWTASVYLSREGRFWYITAIPATFMTAVTSSYFLCAPECLGMLWSAVGLDGLLAQNVSVGIGIGLSIVVLCVFAKKRSRHDSRSDVECLLP